MYARIEVAMQPEFQDPQAQGLLRRLGLAHPEIRKKVRWARWVDVYWLDLPLTREEMFPAIGEIFWDKVLHWLFTGNLIPSAAGKHGGILDLMEEAPNRPGKFWALERRFRPGVTDNVGRTALEAFEIYSGKKFPEGRAASGSLLLLEGVDLDEDGLAMIARDVLCNELVETWTIFSESEIVKSDRFHQERVKREMPKVNMRLADQVEKFSLQSMSDAELETLSKKRLLALSLEEMKAIQKKFPEITDVELEVLAQTWSEHCKHKIFGAEITYKESEKVKTAEIPNFVDSLFKTTIAGTTKELPRKWLLSVFHDNAGIVQFDEEDAFCIKVETHNTPSALDPYGGALTGIVGVNRDILGCGLGARPIFNTDVFCTAPIHYSKPLPERLMHPRRILEGVRRGVEHGGNKSGIPTVNGALYFDDRFLGKPLVYCGTAGMMPLVSAGRKCETKEIHPGDRICMVGGRIGKDGIHGATFSSLALDDASPTSAVQLGDPITQKRTADFLIEARDLGLYRAITDNGAGGLSSSVGELARLSGGASLDVSLAKVKYPGLKPYELTVSESQERMTLAVSPDKMSLFLALAERRGVEVSDLGEFNQSGKLEIFYQKKPVGTLDLEFLHQGVPRLKLNAEWKGRPAFPKKATNENIEDLGAETLIELMGRPNIASKEWLIRQYDHEVQGTSVIKPLHTVGAGTAAHSSGPNDAGVIKPKPQSMSGIAVGCGLNPKLSDYDAYIMAQSAVDEAVRNVLCGGSDYGKTENVIALVDNFCWPDPVKDSSKCAALVRACFGLREAALELGIPLVSGKDSMKNDFRGTLGGEPITISVPPTLLMTAVAKVSDLARVRTPDFKAPGDVIYLLGSGALGLVGSELHQMRLEKNISTLPGKKEPELGLPHWADAKRIYQWIGGAIGQERDRMRSIHDLSDGGLLVAVAESCLARGFGAVLQLPNESDPRFDPWEYCFGEGFHHFVVTTTEVDVGAIEADWIKNKIPFKRLGSVTGAERLDIRWNVGNQPKSWNADLKLAKQAWRKEGYWE